LPAQRIFIDRLVVVRRVRPSATVGLNHPWSPAGKVWIASSIDVPRERFAVWRSRTRIVAGARIDGVHPHGGRRAHRAKRPPTASMKIRCARQLNPHLSLGRQPAKKSDATGDAGPAKNTGA